MRLRLPCTALLLLTLAIPVSAQEADTANRNDTLSSWLTVHANHAGCRAYLDDSLLGRTPLDSVPVAPGRHRLTCAPPDSFDWISSPVSDSIECLPGKLLLKTIQFPRFAYVSSQPDGATASDHDTSELGRTPLWIPVSEAPHPVRLLKTGYKPAMLEVIRDTLVVLEADGSLSGIGGEDVLSTAGSRSGVPVYLTAGAAVLTGAVAAYFKIRADHMYGDYLSSGDGGTLETIHRYDRISGIALAACEINLVALAVLLFRR